MGLKNEILHLFSGLDVSVKLLKLTSKDYLLRKILPRSGSRLGPQFHWEQQEIWITTM